MPYYANMHIKSHTAFRSIADIRADLIKKLRSAAFTQEEIAKKTGVNQGQVSRILNGKAKRVSGNVALLCKYANVPIKKKFDLSKDQNLMDALEVAVAGNAERAEALAGVIKAVGRALDAKAIPQNREQA